MQLLEREQAQVLQEKQELTNLLTQRTTDYDNLLQMKTSIDGELREVKLALAVAQSQAHGELKEVKLALAVAQSQAGELKEVKLALAACDGELRDVKLALAVAQSQAGRTERQEEDLKRSLQVILSYLIPRTFHLITH